MRRLSHSKSRPKRKTQSRRAATPTAAELIASSARRLALARLHYGHGTDNANDDAAALVFHALGLDWQGGPAVYRQRASATQLQQLEQLVTRRIRDRVPAVYLTGKTFFAGLPFSTDPRALIPRSPFAELIESHFAPWIDARQIRRVLDVGTGGGCIALATAHYLPWVTVDAVDVSRPALGLARHNRRALGLQKRVKLCVSDVYSALGQRRYDMILANPPYVGAREMANLPAEYGHEPRAALAAGHDGLDVVRRILAGAAGKLTTRGILIVEVGNSERAVRRAWPRVPFTWLEFSRGGGGVFMLSAEQCRAIP